MRTIQYHRDHNFCDRINHCRVGRKYAYISSEHSASELRVSLTEYPKIREGNWNEIERAYANEV